MSQIHFRCRSYSISNSYHRTFFFIRFSVRRYIIRNCGSQTLKKHYSSLQHDKGTQINLVTYFSYMPNLHTPALTKRANISPPIY